MSRKQKKLLLRIICSAVLFLLGLILPGWFGAGAMILSWIICGWSVAWKAIRNLLHGQLFDENFLMTLATVGAFALQQFSEGAAVMLFYQVGELFQAIAVDRSRRSISQLMDLRPDSAVVLRDGEELEVEPDEVQVGELILVSPGERICVDGVIRSGNADLDTSRITGESMPVSVGPGDAVLSGCVNLSGNLTIEATSEYGQSTVARILDLVENAQEKKAPTEQFITRFARWYTPAVVIAAVLLCTLPPLLLHQSFSLWLKRALTFLVVSCPCALVISVPLSFFGGMAAASKANILIKGGVALEELADPGIVVFDKTGTLTTGTFRVAEVRAYGCTENELLLLAAAAEQYSPHPVAKAILAASPHAPVGTLIEDRPGFGVTALVNGKTVLAGNLRFLSECGVEVREWADSAGTIVYVASDGTFCGCIRVEDSLKEHVDEAIQALYDRGVKDTVLLSGDRKQSVEAVAKALGIRNVYSGLLPQDKVSKLEELLKNNRVMFVGDGVNDAPVLTLATVGIAMGGIGSDAAVEAADVVLLSDEPRRIATAIDIARSTLRIARENIIIALGVKAIVLILGALGIAGMWLAVFADVGVAVIAILNAMRTLRLHEKHGF
ncbi:MAG: cadmium-translocating P-type ATPase [Oscillospiraceae bacterium]|nr:cadmium-translocating P-type ATPase [Oscillospiraceae bacterium]